MGILGPSVSVSTWSPKRGIETRQKSWLVPCWSPAQGYDPSENDEFTVKELMNGKVLDLEIPSLGG